MERRKISGGKRPADGMGLTICSPAPASTASYLDDRSIGNLFRMRSLHYRVSRNDGGHSSQRPSQREIEIHRKPCIRSPCPYDSIMPTPVGRTDTTDGVSGWTIQLPFAGVRTFVPGMEV